MRLYGVLSRFATFGWVVTLVKCHAPAPTGGDVEQKGTFPTPPIEERYVSDTYTMANINITYEDEHGEMYTETSEVSVFIYS